MNYKDNGFPMKKGQINLTSGTYGAGLLLCVLPGDVLITWNDATTDTVTMVEGMAYNFVEGTKSIGITSGTYHLG